MGRGALLPARRTPPFVRGAIKSRTPARLGRIPNASIEKLFIGEGARLFSLSPCKQLSSLRLLGTLAVYGFPGGREGDKSTRDAAAAACCKEQRQRDAAIKTSMLSASAAKTQWEE